jgi:hypothetical protein
MYASVRRYASAEVIARVAERAEEVRELISGVPGFVAYYAVQGESGGATVTICRDRAGAEESNRRAADWVRQHLAGIAAGPPEITAGDVVVSFP